MLLTILLSKLKVLDRIKSFLGRWQMLLSRKQVSNRTCDIATKANRHWGCLPKASHVLSRSLLLPIFFSFFPLPKVFVLESHVSSGGSTKSLAKKYFSELKTNTVKKLYHLYKVDFQLFQYSPDLYIQYSKKTI